MISELQRIPPHQLEAEQSLLGGILVNGEGLSDALEILKGDEFYRPSHRIVFGAMLELFYRNEPIDLVTISNRLSSQGKLEEIGGAVYLANLTEIVPSAANVLTYAGIIHGKSILRKLIHASSEIIQKCYGNISSIEETLNESEAAIFSVCDNRKKEREVTLAEGVKKFIVTLEERIQNKCPVVGIPTGDFYLDRVTCGMNPQELWIVAARPSIGKTAKALNIVKHAAESGVGPILFFSLDMSKEGLIERLLAHEARVDLLKIRNGMMSRDEIARVMSAAGTIHQLPIIIIDQSSTELDIIRKSRKIKPKLIVVDYLTKIIPSKKSGNNYQDYTDITKYMKDLAKELEIPMLLLCQLNRANVNENREPRDSDLRETGQLEQEADVILFLHAPENNKTAGTRKHILSKQRQGEVGTWDLAWMGTYQAFEPLSYGQDYHESNRYPD